MVVCEGDAETDVPVTVPTPLSMESVVAFETDHDNTVDWPVVIEAGLAVKEEMVGGGAAFETVTVMALAVVWLPAASLAMAAKVWEPFAAAVVSHA